MRLSAAWIDIGKIGSISCCSFACCRTLSNLSRSASPSSLIPSVLLHAPRVYLLPGGRLQGCDRRVLVSNDGYPQLGDVGVKVLVGVAEGISVPLRGRVAETPSRAVEQVMKCCER
jgi:hypothetical protein